MNFRTVGLAAPDKRMLRAGIWEPPEGARRRGICVLLQGLTEFLEKYHEVADEMTGRGFTVVGLDWRSQGGSERRSYGNRRGHVGTFEEYDRDLHTLFQQVMSQMEPAPTFALAHSLGAHILLRYLHDNHRRFVCAVLSAPMLEIETGKFSPRLTRFLTLLFNLRRPSMRFLPGIEDRDPMTQPFAENRVTSDEPRYARTQALLKAQPYLRIFGPTFGWLNAALSSMRRMRKRRYAEEITTPLLVFGAGRDRVVRTEAIRAFVKLLPHARYVEIEDSEHEILMERDDIRARFWARFDEFVNGYLPL